MTKLRSSKVRPKGIWSIDEVKVGFDEFVVDHGNYPTALELASKKFWWFGQY